MSGATRSVIYAYSSDRLLAEGGRFFLGLFLARCSIVVIGLTLPAVPLGLVVQEYRVYRRIDCIECIECVGVYTVSIQRKFFTPICGGTRF